jgi:hypothetical protein
VSNVDDTKWRGHLETYMDLADRLGCDPSRRSKDPREKKSGQWIATQRQLAKTGALVAWRVADLAAVRLGWRESNVDGTKWRAHLATLVDLAARLGRNPVSESEDLQEAKSGQWLVHQRWLANKGTLLAWRKAELDAARPGWRAAHGARRTE